MQKKLVEPKDLETVVKRLRSHSLTIATLNGSFDLLHAGHLYILNEAAKQADRLIVALNSDVSIQAYKSVTRPIIPLTYRIEMMTALECVDFVTWFEETDPRSLLELIRPDVHVNGVEYRGCCIEEEVVQRHGGRVHFVERIPSLSTSQIIEKIRRTECV